MVVDEDGHQYGKYFACKKHFPAVFAEWNRGYFSVINIKCHVEYDTEKDDADYNARTIQRYWRYKRN